MSNYAFCDCGSGEDGDSGLNAGDRVSHRYPLMINRIGIIEMPVNFETINKKGRSDYYFLYLVQGKMEIETDRGMELAVAGNLVFFYPYTAYHYRNRSGEPIKYLFIHYTGADARRVTQDCGFEDHRLYDVGVKEKLIASFDDLYKEYLNQQEGYCYYNSGELSVLLVSAMRYSLKKDGKDLFASLEYMNRNYAQELSVSELAAMEHLSPGRYRTVFSETVGISPKEYLTKVRIDKSMELLSSTDLSVSEVAELVGFADPLYFSRIFRKKTGISPSAYKRK